MKGNRKFGYIEENDIKTSIRVEKRDSCIEST